MNYLQLPRCRPGLALSVQMIEFRKTTMAPSFYYRRQIIEIFECDNTFLDTLEAEDLVHSVEDESEQERVFPPDQVERIRIINNLVRDLEVNLAGVEVILAMRENMIRMQRQFDEILEILVQELKGRIPG
jgi:MerR family transcriptional regulator, heat shock protein HspR